VRALLRERYVEPNRRLAEQVGSTSDLPAWLTVAARR
jgi:hypothetical protein